MRDINPSSLILVGKSDTFAAQVVLPISEKETQTRKYAKKFIFDE